MAADLRPVGHEAAARVPATSANLGAGYDTAGIALCLFDDVSAVREPPGTGLRVEIDGWGSESLARDETHLVARSFARGLAAVGVELADVSIRCRNRVPHGRGLGSSSAAIVGGLLLARGMVRDGHRLLDPKALMEIATEIEGHPDNVAPALFGGFTIAWTDRGIGRAVRCEPHPAIRAIALVPDADLPTAAARMLLPEDVPLADACHNVARAGLLVHAVTRDPDFLFDATSDRLHQDYRRTAYPASWDAVRSLRSVGRAAFISGAGTSVLVLTAEPRPIPLPVVPGFSVRSLEIDLGSRV